MSTNLNIKSCPICSKSLEPESQITQLCQYISCSECLFRWTVSKITELQCGPEDTILCIGGCNDHIPVETIASSLQETEEKARIDEALFQVYLNKQSDVRKCPKNGCSYAGVVHASPGCTEPLNCELCGTTWKDKQYTTMKYESLGEYYEKFMLQKDEFCTALWKKLWAEKCPNCKTRIEKNGGCDHMTCRKCKHEFCWICRVQTPNHKNWIHQAKFVLKIIKVIALILTLFPAVYFVGCLIYGIPFVATICDYTILPVINFIVTAFPWVWPVLWKFFLGNAILLLIVGSWVPPQRMTQIQCIILAVVCFGVFVYFGGFFSLIAMYLTEAGIGGTVALGLHLRRKIKIWIRDSDFELPKFLKRSEKEKSYQMLIYGRDSYTNTALSIV